MTTGHRTVLGKTALYLFPGAALTVIAATWLLHVIDPATHRLSHQQTDISIGGHTIRVELADTPAKHRRGLMYRESLGQDNGMLFIYPAEKYLKFWMKDTSIPLSIAYIGNDCRILEFHHLHPHSTDKTGSSSPARVVTGLDKDNDGVFHESAAILYKLNDNGRWIQHKRTTIEKPTSPKSPVIE